MESTSMIDVTNLTSQLTIGNFAGVIQAMLPIVAVAVLCGFLFYAVRWAVGLFRGV